MRVMVGLSGGVDSAIAAWRLQQDGYQVEALFMKNWEEDDEAGYCAAEQDLKDAQQVCERLGLKLHTVNFSAEYWDAVFEHFLAEYRAGRTPNPDVLCNREIKFKAFWEHARRLGAEWMATGHYARVRHGSGGEPHALCVAIDRDKDQTYFLHLLDQEQLSRTLFPLADMRKPQVRTLARELDLPVHDKKDSTGICFIGERRFRDFLSQYLPAQPGDVYSDTGVWMGRHQGLMFFTLGQRQGIGLGGVSGGATDPWYVAAKDLARNRLIVVQGSQHPLLYRQEVAAGQMSWIAGAAPAAEYSCQAKTRYRQPAQDCDVRVEGDRIQVHFHAPQRAPTPGQSLVLYQGECCLGGGIIEHLS